MTAAARLFNVILFGGMLFVAMAITLSAHMLHGASASSDKAPEEVLRIMYLAAALAGVGLSLELLR